MRRKSRDRRFLAISLAASLLGGAGGALLGVCGPFTDTANDAFCPFVLEVFYLGITTGTTPTTYDPAGNVSRLQMAAFLSRTVDGVVRRTSRRAALNQFWTRQNGFSPLGVGPNPQLLASDGTDVWVAVSAPGVVHRRRASDGFLLQTWTGATGASGVLSLAGKIWVTGHTSPGKLYSLPAFGAPGAVTTVATNLGANPLGIAYDGVRIYTANNGPPGSVSIMPLTSTATTVTAGFASPSGAVFDGTNVWVTDLNLVRLDASGLILQEVGVGAGPAFPVFDGANIWVPNAGDNSISVVRASSGVVLATLTGNGLGFPVSAAFDGERILVTNGGGSSVSLWKAAGLAPIGSAALPAASAPFGACSDGISFWISLAATGEIVQF